MGKIFIFWLRFSNSLKIQPLALRYFDSSQQSGIDLQLRYIPELNSLDMVNIWKRSNLNIKRHNPLSRVHWPQSVDISGSLFHRLFSFTNLQFDLKVGFVPVFWLLFIDTFFALLQKCTICQHLKIVKRHLRRLLYYIVLRPYMINHQRL